MERKDHIDALGACLLVMFSATLGLNQVMVKLVNAGLQPVFQAGLRSVLAVIPVLLFAVLMKKRLSIRDGSLPMGIVTGCLFAFEFILLFESLEYTTVARASIFFYTMPIWVALAAHFIIPGERLTLVRLAGLLLAVVGIVIALLNKSGAAPATAIIGDVFCLVASFAWAAIALIARTTKFSRSGPEMQLLYQLVVSAPILLFAALFFGDFIREPTPQIWAIFAVQVLGVVGIGFLTWFWVLSIYPASDMASFSFLAPVFGVLFGWWILGEEVSPFVVLALVLVGMGIYLVNRKPRRKLAVEPL